MTDTTGELGFSDGDLIVLSSKAWPNCFLRMNGTGVKAFDSRGVGSVNLQYYSKHQLSQKQVKSWEILRVHKSTDGKIALESFHWKNCYLRLSGQGKADLQYHKSPPNTSDSNDLWEIFKEEYVAIGEFRLVSNFFSGTYVGMDGKGMNIFTAAGGGSVTARNTQSDETTLTGYFAKAVSTLVP